MESLGKIFGSVARLKTLRLFLFNQHSSFTLQEIAERTRIAKDAARREIVELLSADLLRKKGAGIAARYQANPRFEYFTALNDFVRETTNVRNENMLRPLKRAGTLQLVALSGFFTGAIEPQIDLLVVGDRLDERALSVAVHFLEAELGREIRYASFAAADFRYRRGVYDRLLRDVFDYPHRILIDKMGLKK